MSAASLTYGQLPLNFKWLLVNYQEEPLHVVHDWAVDDYEYNSLAIYQKHVYYWEHLVPSVQIAIFIFMLIFSFNQRLSKLCFLNEPIKLFITLFATSIRWLFIMLCTLRKMMLSEIIPLFPFLLAFISILNTLILIFIPLINNDNCLIVQINLLTVLIPVLDPKVFLMYHHVAIHIPGDHEWDH
jgi:hypothetical protein